MNKVICPLCEKTVSVYISYRGDGLLDGKVRVSIHKRQGNICPSSQLRISSGGKIAFPKALSIKEGK